jgi:hypothetical protein
MPRGRTPNMQLRNLWLTIGFGLVMLVIVASLMPNPPDPAEFKGSDKLEHFATYAFMMLWFAQIYTRNRVRWPIALASALCAGSNSGIPLASRWAPDV